MKPPRHSAVLLAALALLAAGNAAFARPPDEERRGRGHHHERTERREPTARPRLSLDRAIAMTERRYQARVVRAETRNNGDRVVYVLRLLNDAGRVWTVQVDASDSDSR